MRCDPTTIRSRCRRAAILLALLGASLVWTGCSPEKHYKVLSFFFDGVPDPNLLATSGQPGARGGLVRGTPMVVFGHKPYVEDKCNECHIGRIGGLYSPATGEVTSDVCLKCHQQVQTQYPIMHGPVAAVECLWCHAPHEANDKHLLRQNSPDLCLQCHTPELLSPDPPQHMDPKADCLQCHSGHGGQAHGLLKAAPTAPQPAPPPPGGPS